MCKAIRVRVRNLLSALMHDLLACARYVGFHEDSKSRYVRLSLLYGYPGWDTLFMLPSYGRLLHIRGMQWSIPGSVRPGVGHIQRHRLRISLYILCIAGVLIVRPCSLPVLPRSILPRIPYRAVCRPSSSRYRVPAGMR